MSGSGRLLLLITGICIAVTVLQKAAPLPSELTAELSPGRWVSAGCQPGPGPAHPTQTQN